MKRKLLALFLLTFLSVASVLQAQAPQSVTLQSVLRDAAGRLVANRNVGVRITLTRTSASGPVIYQETHTPTTNQNGLYTVFFGQGTATSGTFAGIDWAQGPYYAKVEADPNGGNNYTLTVNHPIVSVPYALYAEQANEQQALSLSNDTIYLTGGGATRSFVKLPALGGGGPTGCVPSCGRIDTIEHKLDSIINLSCIATVHYEARSECDNYTWPVNGQTYELSGTYTYTRTRGNVKGCDSIEMLMLTINRSTHNVETQTVTGFMTWHNIARANTGTYTYEYTNGFGCASVDTLKLKVNTPGTLPGEFTVNAEGKKVKFSSGNLQHQTRTGNWRFAEHQYDAIRNKCGNTSASNSDNTCWMDLFGWGTSGHQVQSDANNLYYRPWNYTNYGEVNSTYNGYGYGPSKNVGSGNLTGAGAILDWGVSNAIANGGNQIGKWRVLTADEWQYLFENTSRTNLRYCFAKIKHVTWINGNGGVEDADATVNGIILFPDSYVHPTAEGVADIQQPNSRNRLFGDNVISAFGWSAMEAAGAVFLPAAGVREANDVYQWNAGQDCTDNNCEVNQNNWGRYWSSTYGTQYCARILWFYNGHLWPNYTRHEDEGYYWDGDAQWQYYLYHYRFNTYRYRGYSVRLVQDIN